MRNLSDESVVEQWSENAYYQYFYGETDFTTTPPCNASELFHFRHRIGEKGAELILKESHPRQRRPLPAEGDSERSGKDDQTAFIDSTVQEKHKLFCKRAGIEPRIGHLKSDHSLGRNFYRGIVGDILNVMLAAAAFNFKRAIRALLRSFLSLFLQHNLFLQHRLFLPHLELRFNHPIINRV